MFTFKNLESGIVTNCQILKLVSNLISCCRSLERVRILVIKSSENCGEAQKVFL